MRCSAALFALVACGSDPELPQADPPCDEHPARTWDTIGQAYLTTWCTPCHASGVVGEARSGAPPGIDFDTSAGIEQWAVRIRARVAGEPTMPPSGGPPDGDREAFLGWLACGLPGLPEDPPPPVCSAPDPIPGPVRASEAPCASGAEVAIEGDLEIDANADLSCVCAIHGALTVTGGTDIEVPLASLDGALTVSGVAGLERLSLPGVERATRLEIAGVPDLHELDLSGLAQVDGPATVTGTGVTRLGLEALGSVAGDLQIRDHAAASLLVLDHLAEVDGDLVLADLDALTFVRGTQTLASLQGSLVLEDLGPVDLDVFGHLVELGGDLVVRRTAAGSLGGFDRLVRVPGSLVVEDNPELVRIWGLPELTAIDRDLTIRSNPLLPPAEATELAARTQVGGLVLIEDNAK